MSEAEIAAGVRSEAKPRSLPSWRTGKPDAFLAAASEAAREALVAVVPESEVGEYLGAKSEGERVVTHLFQAQLNGYRGWIWYVTIARNSRSKELTVNESGLLPSEDSLLAPDWVPWSERIRPEDHEQVADAEQAPEPVAETDAVLDESDDEED